MNAGDAMQALLPFYLNGTLEGADLDRLELWLATDPEGAEALAEAEAELFSTMAANDAVRPPADALTRFSKSLDDEAGSERTASQTSLFARLWSTLVGLPVGLAWATAAAAIVLVLVQGSIKPSSQNPDFEVAGNAAEQANWPFVFIVFKPDASMAEITGLLDGQDAVVSDGPGAGGIFQISFPAKTGADYERIVSVFSSAPVVAEILPGRKPPNG
ncbi:anti-sigma factor [Mesorhizobium sp. NBSH29]|nr:anti-sigma factor [Mesorhizobium sp. NBSH29]